MPELPPLGTKPAPASVSAWTPLKIAVFRMLWCTWLMANISMWMSDVAAAWMMTSLTSSPTWVALVQTASTLPVFLLGLPSGALADILDRRRYFIATQFWLAAVAVLLCVVVVIDEMSPFLLLVLMFTNGIGLAMRWPVFAAIVPELVPRSQLPAALALNGVATNASRIVGPLVAGGIIASAGSAYVFVLNAVLSVLSAFIITRWRHVHVPSPLGRERLLTAMRVGVQFVRQSASVKAALFRIAVFFFHSTALLALLPLVAKGVHRGDAGTFTLLLAAMGGGAILAVMFLPRLRQASSPDTLVLGSALLQSAMTFVVAYSNQVLLTVLAMFVSGMGWIITVNSVSVSVQLALPDWVRARGMAIFQMSVMGASAFGAAVWGHVATLYTVHNSLVIAAVSGTIVMLGVHSLVKDRSTEEDLTPSRDFKAPVAATPSDAGHVQVCIEYCIDPNRADDFQVLMKGSRRSRLRQGALTWELLHDLVTPGRYIEQTVYESWTEHLRGFDRVTLADVAMRERKLSFHIGKTAPVVTRYGIKEI